MARALPLPLMVSHGDCREYRLIELGPQQEKERAHIEGGVHVCSHRVGLQLCIMFVF
jgi:hypothetical protein